MGAVARDQLNAARGVQTDPDEAMKRLKRLRAVLAGQGIEHALEAVPALMGQAIADGPQPGQREVGRQLVQHRREMDAPGRLDITDPMQAQARMARTAQRPLCDPRWDALFGALKVAELRAMTQGKRFGMDYGNFGFDATHDYNPPGVEYNPIDREFKE